MAKNKAKMNKFLTGAITATMVATAVAPVASAASFTDLDRVDDNVKAEIDKAVDLGFFKDAEKFNPAGTINRSQAALTLARYIAGGTANTAALKAYVEANNLEQAGVAPFGDVPLSYKDGNAHQEELFYAALIVKDAGSFTQADLNPTGPVTRSQMAKIIAGAFELDKAADFESDITDINHLDAETKGFIETIASHGVTNVTTFNPAGTVTRSQMASFLVRANEAVNAKAAVLSVNAVNGKTLELTGTALSNLKAEDITIEGTKVESLSPSADGKSATVKLETALNPGQEYKVAVKIDGETTEFTVKYTFNVNSVAVTTTTVDEDTENQQLSLAVNGSAIDLDTLVNTNGWDVEFQANEDVFKNAATTSNSGILDETKLNINDTFTVKVVIKKEGVVVESETATVKVISNVTPTIDTLAIGTTETGTLNSSTISLKDNGVKVQGIYSSTKDVIDISGEKVFASSNPAVASIDSDGNIKPLAPGKTTITVTAGKEVFTKEIEVVNEARLATKATPKYDALDIAKDKERTMTFTVTDQFGDVVSPTHQNLVAKTSNNTDSNHELTADGEVVVTVPANADNGSYTVYIHNTAEKENIGQFKVNVSDANTISSYKIVPVNGQKFDLSEASTNPELAFAVDAFNKDGGFLEQLEFKDATTLVDQDGKEYTVEVADTRFAQFKEIDDATHQIILGLGTDLERTGSTDVVLKKEDEQVAKTTITVVNEEVKVTGISWKANGNTITNKDITITYEDALNITKIADSNVDDIVNGVTLSKNTTSKVRVKESSTTSTELVLYLDKNDNGTEDAGDVVLGSVKATGTAGDVPEILGSFDDLYTTVLDKKGTITFVFTDKVSAPNKVVTSTTLNVDVK